MLKSAERKEGIYSQTEVQFLMESYNKSNKKTCAEYKWLANEMNRKHSSVTAWFKRQRKRDRTQHHKITEDNKENTWPLTKVKYNKTKEIKNNSQVNSGHKIVRQATEKNEEIIEEVNCKLK